MIMNRTWLWLGLAVLSAASAASRDPGGKRVVEPFDYRGVTLGPGPLKAQVDEVRQFYQGMMKGMKDFFTSCGVQF